MLQDVAIIRVGRSTPVGHGVTVLLTTRRKRTFAPALMLCTQLRMRTSLGRMAAIAKCGLLLQTE